MNIDMKMPDSDVVFTTGGYFTPTGFNGDTLKTQALGGSESSLVSLARNWAAMGRRVTVFCNCDKPGIYDSVNYRPNYEFFYVARDSSIKLLIALRYEEYLNCLAQVDRKVLWLQDVPQTRLYQHLKVLPEADLVFLSQYHKDIWGKNFDLTAHQVTLLTNGFDSSFFKTLAPKKRQIIYASRPNRGLSVCLEVFKKLKESYTDLELKVCTYSQEKNIEDDNEYAPYLNGDKVSGVTYLGQLNKNELALELSSSLFLLYPNTSQLETSCVTAIEAMAAGCPVITSDQGALSETVKNTEGGYVVPYISQTEAFINNLLEITSELLRDPVKLQVLQQKCLDFAYARYSWDKLVHDWDLLFIKG